MSPGQVCLCHQRWARSCPAWSAGARGAVAGARAGRLCSAPWCPLVVMRGLGTDVQKCCCLCPVSLPRPSPGPRPPALGQPRQGGSRGCPGRTRRRTASEPGHLTSVQKLTHGGKEARAGPETHLETSLLESMWAGVAVLLVSHPDGGRSFRLRSVYSPQDCPEPSCVQSVSSGAGHRRAPCHNCGNRVTGGHHHQGGSLDLSPCLLTAATCSAPHSRSWADPDAGETEAAGAGVSSHSVTACGFPGLGCHLYQQSRP